MQVESCGAKSHLGADEFLIENAERVSLCEALDRVLNKGAVIVGQVTLSVADVDLVYLGLELVLTSIETARKTLDGARGGRLQA
jgi:gas vesicle structural protein